jgi:stage II sporulation protein P
MKKNNVRSLKAGFTLALEVFAIIIATVLAIKIGTVGGDILYHSDKKIISKADVENFRKILNNSLPIIDTIYNSGNISMSLIGQVKDLIESIFHFDVTRPVTILSAESPLFLSYYYGDYQKYIAMKSGWNTPYINFADIAKEENKTKEENKPKEQDKPKEQEPAKNYDEPASSVAFSEDEESRRTQNPPPDKIVTSGQIKINNNETNYKINIEELLKEPFKLKPEKKGPKVLIYHTHTTEGYLKDAGEIGKSGIQSRTRDERYSVIRVGEELSAVLKNKYGIGVIHNATVHNYPSDTGAYARSLNTAANILKSYPSIQLVIDLHRDAISNDKKLRVVKEINNKNVAQAMFVVGTDSTGLEHPKWKENLKLALNFQQKLNQKYSGLTRPIYISENRYNQHLSNSSLIIEVGGDGNLIGEALETTKYLAEMINEFINNESGQ